MMRYAVWAAVAATTAVASLMPRDDAGQHFGAAFDRFDKLEHLTAYVALGFTSRLPYRDGRRALRSALAMVAFGAVIECLQSFVPGRSCDAWDMVANITGVALGYWSAGRSWLIKDQSS